MKPILFNGPMVKSILCGKKSQTRRPIKLGKYRFADADMCEPMNGGLFVPNPTDFVLNVPSGGLSKAMQDTVVYPPYRKGDKLYVRETYAPNFFPDHSHAYRAEWGDVLASKYLKEPKWVPSIHMPKKAARLFLEVTDVVIERLWDIDEVSAELEGVEPVNNTSLEQRYYNYNNPTNAVHDMSYIDGFKQVWESVYGSWPENPWVFVIKFKTMKR